MVKAERTPENVVPTSNATTSDRVAPEYGLRVEEEDFMLRLRGVNKIEGD